MTFYCLSIPDYTTEEDIFKVTDKYFNEHNLEWLNYISICTDEAATTTGKIRFIIRVSEKTLILKIYITFFTRKHWWLNLYSMNFCLSIKILNYIKSRPLNSRLFNAVSWNGSRPLVTFVSYRSTMVFSQKSAFSIYKQQSETQTFLEA